MRYTSRGLKRRRGTDKWDVTLSHRDPLSGGLVSTYHTVEGSTRKKAEKARDELILELERCGNAYNSKLTLSEFLDKFIAYKEGGMLVERSTAEHYRKQAKVICRYPGAHRLSELTIPAVSGWMAQMAEEGYAPRSVAKPFGLLRQAMNHAVALDLVYKNLCDHCKPPKIKRKKINALDRAERTRMLKIAQAAEPSHLALAVELALTTGMRRGEICGLRWSDIDEREVTVNRSISLDNGRPYEKEPKTEGGRRTIPLTRRLYDVLRAVEKDRRYVAAELGVPFGDPYVPGTPDPGSRPYHPTQLTRDFQGLLRDERLPDDVPRPETHVRHHDDCGRDRRAHRGELPRAHERGDDAQHLRGGRPRRQARCPRQDRRGVRCRPRRCARRRARGTRVHDVLHRGTARGHARSSKANCWRP